jgi:hypothetical protein
MTLGCVCRCLGADGDLVTPPCRRRPWLPLSRATRGRPFLCFTASSSRERDWSLSHRPRAMSERPPRSRLRQNYSRFLEQLLTTAIDWEKSRRVPCRRQKTIARKPPSAWNAGSKCRTATYGPSTSTSLSSGSSWPKKKPCWRASRIDRCRWYAFRHGYYTAEAIATRRNIATLLRDARALIKEVS